MDLFSGFTLCAMPSVLCYFLCKLEMIRVLCPWKNLFLNPPFHPSCASQKERVIIERRVETMMSEDIRLLSAPSLVERR
jgi:hypothetical protein